MVNFLTAVLVFVVGTYTVRLIDYCYNNYIIR
ncbi:Uncharacterised protein [Bacteroides intestinalis]|jgi:hypothetical protein|uniref:Uncharacterized protein n=1 Tax=Bacteroides intestinalis TaxID=329854 RepID=A0A6N2XLI9_9BACE|nr:MAG TPA: hypothetical protein [Caudoviricetes sp.]DAT15498.1 MAG TPA: hypothetical protein [Caudoviricetes sp.]